ncbi:GvpL/GvpF family gas vesicle protein [bacterium]|nr:GvpL/GvpF family gas vesicle protein [Planctomycetota bacterium]MBU1517966.1 GvpL/GvpF family gas vesicle protein [Planctomycetota bacterium]MBU2461769.1 GvpL/GvpF family gas vesicle protein [bacterium]
MDVATKEGKYIYCVIDSNQPQSFGPLGIGGRGDEVYTICFDDIAALVSNAPIKKYRISRENSLTHEKAIEAVMAEHTVLPVRFATVTQDEEKVMKILEAEYDRFRELLVQMKDKTELGVKAIFKEEVIYKHILEKYGYIRVLKEKIADLPPERTHHQRMKIGEMVEAALQQEKQTIEEDILNTLSPLAVEVKTNNPYGELMIINAAFLVEKEKEADFDRQVQELSNKYGEKVNFKYVGLLPPFNFVNLVIETGKY